ncbi:MAG: glycosyltransferase family 1 protein [Anaerolineae bacterium]|nr:glycosyltransferase family 1 protein [Anaerolineae bacterium]
MRIALFAETFLPKWDGVANTTCHLLDHLALRGHESLMFAPEGAPERYAETPVIGLRSFTFPFYTDLKLVSPIVSVERQLEAFKPDLVHLVNPALLGLVGLRHARQLGIPAAASYHTDLPGYSEVYGMGVLRDSVWAYFRWLHNQADLNLCPSTFTKQQLENHGFQRVKVWSHGVDAATFNPRYRSAEWRERLTGGHPEAPLLLYVGRLAVEKRVDWLRPLLDAVPGARLAIVGDGPVRQELATLFEGTPTVFTGYLTGEALSRAYAAADLFVFPSDSETFGNVILEAMASGVPAIAPRAGGPVDIVADGRNGFLFDAECRDEMIHLVREVLGNPVYLRYLALGARAYAESQSWERVMDQLLDDYRVLLDSRAILQKWPMIIPAPRYGRQGKTTSPRRYV